MMMARGTRLGRVGCPIPSNPPHRSHPTAEEAVSQVGWPSFVYLRCLYEIDLWSPHPPVWCWKHNFPPVLARAVLRSTHVAVRVGLDSVVERAGGAGPSALLGQQRRQPLRVHTSLPKWIMVQLTTSIRKSFLIQGQKHTSLSIGIGRQRGGGERRPPWRTPQRRWDPRSRAHQPRRIPRALYPQQPLGRLFNPLCAAFCDLGGVPPSAAAACVALVISGV